MKLRRIVRGVLALLVAFVLVALTLWLIAMVCVIAPGFARAPRRADAAVVLGAAVWPGGVPSPVLSQRTRTALGLYREGRVALIATTGGIGRIPPSEASVSRALLLHEGVDTAHVLTEERSHTTEENLAFVAPVLRARGVTSVFVVSNGYHLARALRITRSYGFEAHGIATDGSVFASLRAHPGRWFSEAALILARVVA